MVSRVWGHASGTVSGKTAEGESVGPVRVELDLSGSVPEYVLQTSATPSLTAEEVNRLLTVGPVRPEGEAAAEEAQTADEMIARAVASRVFRGVLEPIEEELTESFGLEQFVITVGVNQPVEFRVDKYLVENLLVSYRRTAGGPEPESDLRVSYRLRGKYQLSWHTDDRQRSEFGVEYRWHF